MSKKRKRPVVGQTIYGRVRTEGEIVPLKVVKVGRRFFEINHLGRPRKIYLDTWRAVENFYIFGLYESEREYLDERERDRATDSIVKKIRNGNYLPHLPLETLQQIDRLLSFPTKEEDEEA